MLGHKRSILQLLTKAKFWKKLWFERITEPITWLLFCIKCSQVLKICTIFPKIYLTWSQFITSASWKNSVKTIHYGTLMEKSLEDASFGSTTGKDSQVRNSRLIVAIYCKLSHIRCIQVFYRILYPKIIWLGSNFTISEVIYQILRILLMKKMRGQTMRKKMIKFCLTMSLSKTWMSQKV